MSRLALAWTVAAGLAFAAGTAPAVAESVTSTNWSGYAVHRSGVSFRRVSAEWRQPAATCSSGVATYSAFWVGLGGYSLSSSEMEQIGTELDCDAGGGASLSAWYELVPAPSRAIRMTVQAGDLIRAEVSVSGHRVRLVLADLTRGESFARTILDHRLDVSSAEWIAEAPSDCVSSSRCETLPLADFGSVRFFAASAETTGGARGGIDSGLWGRTRIFLGYSEHGAEFVADSTGAHAAPGAVAAGGFTVTYSGVADSGSGSAAPGGEGDPGAGGPGGYGGDPGASGPGGGSGPP